MGLQWKVVLGATGAIILGMILFGVPSELLYTGITHEEFSPTSAFSWFLNLMTTAIVIFVSYRVTKRGTPNPLGNALLAVLFAWLIHNGMHALAAGNPSMFFHSMTEIDHMRLLILTMIGGTASVLYTKRQAQLQVKTA